MSQLDPIVNRTIPARPWAEGDNIPWDEPAFSIRMLQEHLDQSHDLASRRFALIDTQVQYVHSQILQSSPARILDLACGPGLYAQRLTELGHSYAGIDFSPAAIAHARTAAPGARFTEADLRTVDFPQGSDLIMMLYGQINVFRRAEAASIVTRALASLNPGGRLLLEAQSADHVRDAGQAPPAWTAQPTGLFSHRPHILLTESFWDETDRTATQRFFVIDTESTAVARYAMSNEAYTEQEYAELLDGYEEVRIRAHEPGWPKGDELILVMGRSPL